MELNDIQERRRAILSPAHAFVWASAGTGKTHTLTLRALSELLTAPFRSKDEPDLRSLYDARDRSSRLEAARQIVGSIVLTTFTRKAAAEMQTRLAAYLDRIARAPDEPGLGDSSNNDPLFGELLSIVTEEIERDERPESPGRRLRLGAEALAHWSSEMRISTLHSLAASILARHPFESGLGPHVRFAREDESDWTDVPERLLDRWWGGPAQQEPELASALEEVLQVADIPQIRRWLDAAQEFPWIASLEWGREANVQERDPAEAQPTGPPSAQSPSHDLSTALDACRALIHILGRPFGNRFSETWRQFVGHVDRVEAWLREASAEPRPEDTAKATLTGESAPGAPTLSRNSSADHQPLLLSTEFGQTSGKDFPYLFRGVDSVGLRVLGGFCRFLERPGRCLFLAEEPNKQVQRALEALDPPQRRYFEQPSRLIDPLVGAALSGPCALAWEAFKRVLERFRRWSRGAGVRELGLVTFDDMIRRTVGLLERHPHVLKAERDRMRVLLVDEFQDTDPRQLRLIADLLRRSREDDHEIVGFFVGDRKQSIYRFRGTDIDAISRFRDRYGELLGGAAPRSRLSSRGPADAGDRRFLTQWKALQSDRPSEAGAEPIEELQLTTNFRCLPPLAGFANRFFQEVTPLAGPEEALDPYRKIEDGPVLWQVVQDARDAAAPNAAEARKWASSVAVQEVRRLAEEGLVWAEMTLLVRKESELTPLLEALAEAGIPTVSSGSRTFYRRPEVLDLLNLLIALHHRDDSLATAAAARSPYIGLDGAGIEKLRREISGGDLLHAESPLPDEIDASVAARIDRLRVLAAGRASADSDEWLDQVFSLFPLHAYLHPSDREGRCLMRAQSLLERFREELVSGSAAPLVWLLRQRERADRGDFHETDLGEDVSSADQTIDAVQVLTIHRAKGLENRAVIVCGWQSVLEEMAGEFPSRRPPEVLRVRSGGERLKGVRLPWGPFTVESPQYADALQAEMEAGRREAARLAYVAATRARDRLILISAAHRRSKVSPEVDSLLRAAGSSVQVGWETSGTGLRPVVSTGRGLSHDLWPGILSIRTTIPGPVESIGSEPEATCPPGYRELWRERLRPRMPEELWHSPTDAERGEGCDAHEDEAVAAAGEWGGPDLASNAQTPSGATPEQPSSLFGEEGADPRIVGILVHRYLEYYLNDAEFRHESLRLLAEESTEPPSLRRAARLLRRFYQGQVRDPRGRACIERVRRSRLLGRELPLYLKLDDQLWFGVLDLALEDERGIVGVDFKTSAEPDLEEEARQERIYSEALRRLYPDDPVRFEFWRF